MDWESRLINSFDGPFLVSSLKNEWLREREMKGQWEAETAMISAVSANEMESQ